MIAVVEKTFSVLEALARLGEPVALVRLSAEVALPKPTAYRILQSLVNLGYVAQEEGTGHYFTTDRLRGLAARDPHFSLKEMARPTIERLHERFNETVNLGVLDGTDVIYLLVKETTQPLRWVVRPGRSDPYYCTALGRAIAAFLPLARLEALLTRTQLKPVGTQTVSDEASLRKILAETRRRGWASEEEEAEAGVACLAMPLAPLAAGEAAISLSIPLSRFTKTLRDEVIEEFRQLANA
jgi:DNA-binding IclR family transcriptional regulator